MKSSLCRSIFGSTPAGSLVASGGRGGFAHPYVGLQFSNFALSKASLRAFDVCFECSSCRSFPYLFVVFF